MLESAHKQRCLGRNRHEELLLEAAEARLAAQATGWGARWRTAQLLLFLAARLSAKQRALLRRDNLPVTKHAH